MLKTWNKQILSSKVNKNNFSPDNRRELESKCQDDKMDPKNSRQKKQL